MFSLHANGRARLIFRSPDQNPILEGVLINENTEETLGLVGKLNTQYSNDSKTVVDINVTDGETGQLYIIRRIQLVIVKDDHQEKVTNQPTGELLDAGVSTGALETAPNYELHSEALRFTTEEILVGNRADREINEYLNLQLSGQLFRVYVGPMSIHFTTAITPPSTPVPEANLDKRLHHISICGYSDEMITEQTDADINFLM